MAILTFSQRFEDYLLGRKFEFITDHRALKWLHNIKDPDGLTAKWLEKLVSFGYEIKHRPGKSFGHADGLSRREIVNQVPTTQTTENLEK